MYSVFTVKSLLDLPIITNATFSKAYLSFCHNHSPNMLVHNWGICYMIYKTLSVDTESLNSVFFYLSGFSFTNIRDLEDSKGRKRLFL